jgi:hypothetical protein
MSTDDDICFDNENAALDQLAEHYIVTVAGMIDPRDPQRPPLPAEAAAIRFLVDELDYGYSGMALPLTQRLAQAEDTLQYVSLCARIGLHGDWVITLDETHDRADMAARFLAAAHDAAQRASTPATE